MQHIGPGRIVAHRGMMRLPPVLGLSRLDYNRRRRGCGIRGRQIGSLTPVSRAINYLSLSVFTLVLASGQLLFKRVGLSIRGLSAPTAAATLLREPALYVALATYGAATILWIWILARVPLVQAYPWVAVGVIIVPLLSSHFLGERIAPLFWVGATLVAAGLMLTQLSMRGS